MGPSSPRANPLTHLRGLLLLIPWLAYLLAADIILSLLLLLKPFRPDTVYDASSAVAWTVWRWIQAVFEGANGADVEVSVSVSAPATGGDSLPPGESAVVVANHVGWCDFYMIQALALRSGMLGRCRWFAKIQLRRVPFLGWGLWAMGMPMVSRKWMRDRLELDRVFGGIVERRWPVCTCFPVSSFFLPLAIKDGTEPGSYMHACIFNYLNYNPPSYLDRVVPLFFSPVAYSPHLLDFHFTNTPRRAHLLLRSHALHTRQVRRIAGLVRRQLAPAAAAPAVPAHQGLRDDGAAPAPRPARQGRLRRGHRLRARRPVARRPGHVGDAEPAAPEPAGCC